MKNIIEITLPQTEPEVLNKLIGRLYEAGITSPPFIPIERGGKKVVTYGKKPKMADGSLNPRLKLSPNDAIYQMKCGDNIGIYAFLEGLAFLDLDVKGGSTIIPQDLCDNLIVDFDTFTVKTRSGGYHLYFLNEGSTENPHIYYNGKDAGECRRDWQYVVAPGSFVPLDADSKVSVPSATGLYSIYRDAPIRKFDPSQLPKEITLGTFVKDTKKPCDRNTPPNITLSDTEFKNIDGVPLDDFRRKHKKLDNWLDGANEEDRSAADFGVACKLAYYNFTEDVAARILQVYRPYEKTAREDYITSTISKAFSATLERWNQSRKAGDGHLPEIDITGKPLRDISDESIRALHLGNNPPCIFVRNGYLTRIIRDEKGRPKIDQINENALRGLLDRSADFITPKKGKGGEEYTAHVRPPPDVVSDIMALGSWDFPALKGIIGVPIIREDGTIINSEGYDAPTRLFYAPVPGLEIPPVPELPTREDIDSSLKLLQEVFCDFPFDGDESRANVLGLLITAVMRPLISGQVPMALIDKPQAGTGATLIASVTSMVATGQIGGMMPLPEDDDEMRKKITSRLIAGDSLLIIDNIEGQLSSPSLATILTTGLWNDRILGQTRTVNIDACVTLIATGNNIRLGGDMPRRCYQIRIDANRAIPWDRTGFKHPRLEQWVKAERGKILCAIYTLVRAWIHAGKPKPMGISNLGSFEAWRDFIGGILEYTGVPGFLGNLTRMYEESDVDTPQWSVFLETLYQICGSTPFTTAEIEGVLENERNHTLSDTGGNRCLTDSLPNHIADAWLSRKNFTRVLGNDLGKQKDRLFPNGLKIIKYGSHAGAVRWLVQQHGESQKIPSIVDHGESGESSINRTICT